MADQMVSSLAASQPSSRLGRVRSAKEQAVIALVTGVVLMGLVVGLLTLVGLLA